MTDFNSGINRSQPPKTQDVLNRIKDTVHNVAADSINADYYKKKLAATEGLYGLFLAALAKRYGSITINPAELREAKLSRMTATTEKDGSLVIMYREDAPGNADS
jgi:hypothetical protein